MQRSPAAHLLRQSFATGALRKGMNPVQLAQVLGHSGLRMIEHVYSHRTATDAYDAVITLLVSEWGTGRPQRPPLAVPSGHGLA